MHRHVIVQLGLVASYLIVLHAAADIIAGGFPQWVPARAFKQSITD